MGRTTNVPVTKARHNKFLKLAKGYWGGRSKLYKHARTTVNRAMAYATKHRRLKKRDFRALWITRITAAVRANDFSYSRFIDGLKKADVALDRKSLSEIAQYDEVAFSKLINLAKSN